MKQGLFTLGLSVALSIMAGCRSQQEGGKLVWEENFDQEDHFDEALWSKIPRGKSDWNNYMSDFDSCYTMRDGNLVLRGLVNYSLPADTAPFITGGRLFIRRERSVFPTGVWISVPSCMGQLAHGQHSGCCQKMRVGRMVARSTSWNA